MSHYARKADYEAFREAVLVIAKCAPASNWRTCSWDRFEVHAPIRQNYYVWAEASQLILRVSRDEVQS